MKRLIPLALLAPLPLFAQDFSLREDDQRIPPAELAERLSGRDLIYYDNGRSRYYADGRYSYTFDGDVMESAGGYWTIKEDGTICAEFISHRARCDLFVENNGRLVLIDEQGGRYPVKRIE
ncbi:MAG: hypothetical protein N4A70_18570 [Pelagimonas sp.]|jgi:hypothetical protein|nr:hypothetical protein [Pelagimonas sp.]